MASVFVEIVLKINTYMDVRSMCFYLEGTKLAPARVGERSSAHSSVTGAHVAHRSDSPVGLFTSERGSFYDDVTCRTI